MNKFLLLVIDFHFCIFFLSTSTSRPALPAGAGGGVTVPVSMVRGLVAVETGLFSSELPSFDRLTRDPRDRPW